MLTPLNYSTPVKKRINNLNTEIFNNLGQYLHTEMETVRIETSTNIIGFDFFTKPKVEQFIKFDKDRLYLILGLIYKMKIIIIPYQFLKCYLMIKYY